MIPPPPLVYRPLNQPMLMRTLAIVSLVSLLCSTALAQAPRRPREEPIGIRDNPKMLAAFREVVKKPAQSVVRVLADGKDAALGTVVFADGYVLTKNTQLAGAQKIEVKLPDGKELEAKVVGVEDKHDLAMLKIDAKDLTPITWGDAKTSPVGNLLATPGTGADPLAIGVLSVAARNVRPRDLPPTTPPANSGFLGVGLEEGEGGAKIISLVPNSAAAKASLQINDIVTYIEDVQIIDTETMINTIQHHKPGDVVTIKYRRGEKELQTRATLDKRPADPNANRRDFQNRLGSELSNRRGGFPAILQHDMVLKPIDCGGPVVDLDGKAIGINIARAGRTETYALPAENVQALLADLKSGKLAPPKAATKPATTKPVTTKPAATMPSK